LKIPPTFLTMLVNSMHVLLLEVSMFPFGLSVRDATWIFVILIDWF